MGSSQTAPAGRLPTVGPAAGFVVSALLPYLGAYAGARWALAQGAR